jgi:glucose/arabinose dehydrogenase
VLYDKWPTDTSHGWKYIAFGPDGKLYVPLGAPCNVCYRGMYTPSRYCFFTDLNTTSSSLQYFNLTLIGDDLRYATIMRQTSVDRWDSWDIYASGVRNTVGFDCTTLSFLCLISKGILKQKNCGLQKMEETFYNMIFLLMN